MKTEENICTQILDEDNFKGEFNSLCAGKKNCTLLDFNFFLTGEGLGANRTLDGAPDIVYECTQSNSRMFVQFMCKQDEE